MAFIVSLEEKDRQSYDIGNRWTFLQSSEGNPDKQLILYSPAMKLPSKSWRIIRHAASREFTISRGTKKALNWFVHLKYERPERDANVAALLNAFLEEPDLSGRKSQLGYLFLHDILTGGCVLTGLSTPASSSDSAPSLARLLLSIVAYRFDCKQFNLLPGFALLAALDPVNSSVGTSLPPLPDKISKLKVPYPAYRSRGQLGPVASFLEAQLPTLRRLAQLSLDANDDEADLIQPNSSLRSGTARFPTHVTHLSGRRTGQTSSEGFSDHDRVCSMHFPYSTIF